MEHLTRHRTGYTIRIPRSKTDQEAEGRKVGLPFGSQPLTCPVRALRDWLERAGIERGPLYSHPRHIILVEALPQNGAGKIDRAVVRRQLQAHAATAAEVG